MELRKLLFLAMAIGSAGVGARAQDNNKTPAAGSLPVIKSETRVVLVDAVVTDKKGEYVRDLESKYFRFLEYNK